MNKIILIIILLSFLTGCNNQDIAPEIVFPDTGEMLNTECNDYDKFSFGVGSEITVKYLAPSETNFEEHSFDLQSSETTEKGPVITLYRNQDVGRIISYSLPIDEIADKQYIMDTISNSEFTDSSDDENYSVDSADINVKFSYGGTDKIFGVFADGTLCFFDESTKISKNSVNYYMFSALAYKYASDTYDIGAYQDSHWLLWAYRTVYIEDGYFSEILPSSYKLCISGENFHIDLDLNQAKLLFSTLFGENELSEGNNTIKYSVLPYGEIISEKPIRFTEYLNTEGTTYCITEPQILSFEHYLYPNGTVLQPAKEELTYFYSGGICVINSSYKRAAVAENAFDNDKLIS